MFHGRGYLLQYHLLYGTGWKMFLVPFCHKPSLILLENVNFLMTLHRKLLPMNVLQLIK